MKISEPIALLVVLVLSAGHPTAAEAIELEEAAQPRVVEGVVVEPVVTTSVEGNEITPEQIAEIQRRWQKLFEGKQHPEGPGLKSEVSVPLRSPDSLGPQTEPMSTRAPGSLVLFRVTDVSAAVPGGFSSTVNEPSLVVTHDRVLFTGNWYAATSTDRGSSFSFLNPFSGPSAPPASGGFCCDQTSVYSAATDTLFFLQQYLNDANTGVQRINVDRGGDGTFDCFYDITPQGGGIANQNWFDYPDLAVSDGFLFHASNVFSTSGGGFTAGWVARYPLSQITSCSALSYSVYTDPSFGSFRLTRGATDTMYFASHATNTSIKIWTWPSGSSSPTSATRSVTAWSNATRVCPGPDGRDWCGFIDQRLQGAWVANGIVGFSWVPSQDGSHSYPYVRMARFSLPGLTLTDEPEVYNNAVAFAYPSVDVNRNGDLGGTIMFGGGATYYPSCAAWLADDENGDTLAPLENVFVVSGTSGPSSNRSGDYSLTRTVDPNNRIYAGACFGYLSTNAGAPRFVLFGRDRDGHDIFFDDFDIGDTREWSAVSP